MPRLLVRAAGRSARAERRVQQDLAVEGARRIEEAQRAPRLQARQQRRRALQRLGLRQPLVLEQRVPRAALLAARLGDARRLLLRLPHVRPQQVRGAGSGAHRGVVDLAQRGYEQSQADAQQKMRLPRGLEAELHPRSAGGVSKFLLQKCSRISAELAT